MAQDQDFLDPMNPCAGQFSSLADLIPVVQMLVNPAHPKSLITRFTRDKWLHAVHDFEEDDWTELGWPWEIIKAPDSNGRLRKIYWKRAWLLHPYCIVYDDVLSILQSEPWLATTVHWRSTPGRRTVL